MKVIQYCVATWFGLGNISLCPGTMGTIGTIPLLLLVPGTLSQIVLLTALFFIGIWVSPFVIDDLNQQDPGCIVIDEVVGFLITMLWVPVSALTIVIGFVLFRFFDIRKPLGIKRLEALHGGWGVMMDDVLAGIYSNFLLHLILFVFKLN